MFGRPMTTWTGLNGTDTSQQEPSKNGTWHHTREAERERGETSISIPFNSYNTVFRNWQLAHRETRWHCHVMAARDLYGYRGYLLGSTLGDGFDHSGCTARRRGTSSLGRFKYVMPATQVWPADQDFLWRRNHVRMHINFVHLSIYICVFIYIYILYPANQN